MEWINIQLFSWNISRMFIRNIFLYGVSLIPLWLCGLWLLQAVKYQTFTFFHFVVSKKYFAKRYCNRWETQKVCFTKPLKSSQFKSLEPLCSVIISSFLLYFHKVTSFWKFDHLFPFTVFFSHLLSLSFVPALFFSFFPLFTIRFYFSFSLFLTFQA